MEFYKHSLKMLATMTALLILSGNSSGVEIKQTPPQVSEISPDFQSSKANDLKADSSHGYGYYGPAVGLSYGYTGSYSAKQPYYPGYYSGYAGKPSIGLGGYHNPSIGGYSYGLGSGFGLGYPGVGYHGYNPGFSHHHHGAIAPYHGNGYPFIG